MGGGFYWENNLLSLFWAGHFDSNNEKICGRMDTMIAIIDYGMGNIRSVQKAFEKVGASVVVTSSDRVVKDAKAVVLPGVGAFRDCINSLHALGLTEAIVRSIEAGKPFLGICLGLQCLFEESEEFGHSRGLGILKGKVVRFTGEGLKIPHMGWNLVRFVNRPPFISSELDNSYFYFVHSYYVIPESKDVIGGVTNYGVDFTSLVYKDNILATQFHPEKSQSSGLGLIRAFSGLVSSA